MTRDGLLKAVAEKLDEILAESLDQTEDLLRRLGGTDVEVEAELDRQERMQRAWRQDQLSRLRAELSVGATVH